MIYKSDFSRSKMDIYFGKDLETSSHQMYTSNMEYAFEHHVTKILR
jgi:hypothetical protein